MTVKPNAQELTLIAQETDGEVTRQTLLSSLWW